MTHPDLIEPCGLNPFIDRIKPYLVRFNNPKSCESALNIGVFFDGTDNNLIRDVRHLAHTNIARLWECYPSKLEHGTASLYVPGVGTAFEAINSGAEGWRGTAFGIGCEARVLFGLLKTLDFVHQFVKGGEPRYSKDQLRVLCKQDLPANQKDLRLVQALGTIRGLQECGDNGSIRQTFLSNESKYLQGILAKSSVKVTELVIDIFGFSRGAASARAYATWLTEILDNGKLAGIPLTIRFMGLFDTVASAGIIEMIKGGINNSTGGHSGWAGVQTLRIPKNVVNCVHFVAMHELRKNFPVDTISMDGKLPPNFHEFAYPGCHSDVGGGYAPGALGVVAGATAESGDALKLSQIPLNHLFAYAVAGFVPLSKDLVRRPGQSYDPFAVAPQLQRDFVKFVQQSGQAHRHLRDWMEAYLAWRWYIRDMFAGSGQVKNATNDRDLLLAGNRKLIADAAKMLAGSPKPAARKVIRDMIFEQPPDAAGGSLDIEAPAVLQRAMQIGLPPAALTNFFEKYVHDSYAGFIVSFTEPTGYWRYRKGFSGSFKVLNADANGDTPEINQLS